MLLMQAGEKNKAVITWCLAIHCTAKTVIEKDEKNFRCKDKRCPSCEASMRTFDEAVEGTTLICSSCWSYYH